MAHNQFIQKGYPIGSGMVESGNKLVAEVRHKGSGMHWHRTHVNPMLALRTATCSGTWEASWPAITQQTWSTKVVGSVGQTPRCVSAGRLTASGALATSATQTCTSGELRTRRPACRGGC
jgi:hypothetical protein